MLISSQRNNLVECLGRSIKNVKRQIFTPQRDIKNYDLNADGPTEVVLDSGTHLTFESDTEKLSLSLNLAEMPVYGSSYEPIELGGAFIIGRMESKIKQIIILKSEFHSQRYPSEFGIELKLENGNSLVIEYVDEDDQCRLSGKYDGPKCVRLDIIDQ